MKGYEVINRMLVEAGVETVFQYMAEDTMELMSDMDTTWANELDVVHARHEQGAMAMADGYARSGDRIGVCIVGRGPGIAQIGTALVNARKNGSRVLVMAPLPAITEAHDPKDFEQTMYLQSTAENVMTIWSHETLVTRFSEALRRVYVGESPLAVQIPKDVLNSTMNIEVDEDELTFAATESKPPRRRTLRPPPARLTPDPDLIEAATELYLDSDAYQPPVILAGIGAQGATAQLEALAERLSAVLITSLKGRNLFEDHPFSIGFSGNWGEPLSNEFVTEASFVLAIGCSLNHHTVDDGDVIGDDTTIVHVDVDPKNLERYTPVDLAIVGDARETTEAFASALDAAGIDRRGELWTDDLRERIATYSALEGQEYPKKPGVMDPRETMRKLEEVLPDDRLIAADGGCFRRWALHEISSPPRDSLISCDFGAIGLGLPLGIGAAQFIKDGGNPSDGEDGRTPVTICGDGGFLMSVQELETAARHEIPLVVIVGNDSSLGSEYHHLAVRGYDPDLARLSTPKLADVAEAFGLEAHVAKSLDDIEEIGDRLQNPEGPILVECIVDHEVRHHSY